MHISKFNDVPFFLFYLEWGWTLEGPQEDSNKEALPAPSVVGGEVGEERAARCKLESGWLTSNAKGPEQR